jgi:hypothetical protein
MEPGGLQMYVLYGSGIVLKGDVQARQVGVLNGLNRSAARKITELLRE